MKVPKLIRQVTGICRDTAARKLIPFALASIGLAACADSPQGWSQFHGDLPNLGFKLVGSRGALAPVWQTMPYKITTSSPVVGRDPEGNEVVYIGASDGKFVAIDADDGTEKWDLFFGSLAGVFVATPAVAESGDIYFITTARPDAGRPSSFLHKVDALGNLKWSFFEFPDDGVTFSSPKVMKFGDDTLILVYVMVRPASVQGELFVLRDGENGPELLDRKSLGFCEHVITGSSDIIDTFIEIFGNLWDDITNYPPEFDPLSTSPVTYIDPTVAVVTERQRPLIAIADNLCNTGAYEWNGATLDVLWHQTHKNFEKHSSPTVVTNGLMIFGREDGQVLAYDIESGSRIWEYDAGESVVATPAAFGPVTFIVSFEHVHVVHASDGTVFRDDGSPRILDLEAPTVSSPALTADHVYVAHPLGMLSLSYDLRTRGDDVDFSGNGMSSPAIGDHGSVFAVDREGRLVKYPGLE